jgi:hypothetical protein
MVVSKAEPTGASMHCRNFCSNCAQPCTLYPEEAQQPVQELASRSSHIIAGIPGRELWRNHGPACCCNRPIKPSKQ